MFWQLNVDLFSPEQGKRLFGFVAAGATMGAIVGAAITASLARYVSPTPLLIGAALLLEVAVFAVGRLARLSPALHRHPQADPREKAAERPVGGSIFAGISHALGSPYLLNVGGSAALRHHLDVSLFPAGGDRQPQLCRSRRADPVLRDHRSRVNMLTLVVQLFYRPHPALLGVSLSLASCRP